MSSTTPEAYYQERAAPPGSALHYALLFAPPDRRDAVAAVCAFQRAVDAAGREAADAGVGRIKLQWWRDEVQRLFRGEPRHPISTALAGAVAARRLPREQFLEVIAGAEMDLDTFAYQSFQELTLYYHRTGSMPSLMAAEVLGCKDPRTLKYAHYLGTSLRLCRAIRGARRNAAAGRLHLPLDELEQHGVSVQDLASGRDSPGVRALFQRQVQRSRDYYRMALDHLADVDRRRQCSGVILGEIAMVSMDRVARDGFPRPGCDYAPTPIRKLWIAWRTYRRESGRAPAP